MKNVTLAFVFLAGSVFGLLAGTGGEVQAQGQRNIHYEVVSASRETTIERELNQKVRYGCAPILMSGAGTEVIIILECPDDAQARRNIHYEVISTGKEQTMERELNQKERYGCVPILLAANWKEVKTILKCPN